MREARSATRAGYAARMSDRPGYAPTKEQMRNRLSRIEGQVRGVARMVEEER